MPIIYGVHFYAFIRLAEKLITRDGRSFISCQTFKSQTGVVLYLIIFK